MIKKILNFKFVIRNCNRGMTYVELIVVLSIFSIISGVTLFNYKQFQLKVDIKNLAHDMTLKIVEAQKSAISGKLAPISQPPSNPLTWKPSYGVYFNINASPTTFYRFIDLDYTIPPQNKQFDFPVTGCPPATEECLEKIDITKGNYISNSLTKVFYKDLTGPTNEIVNNLHITFTRPNSGATFKSTSPVLTRPIDHVEITVSSSDGGLTSVISVYPSGRIELN